MPYSLKHIEVQTNNTVFQRIASLPSPTYTSNSWRFCKLTNASRNPFKTYTVKLRLFLEAHQISLRISSNSCQSLLRKPRLLNARGNKLRRM